MASIYFKDVNNPPPGGMYFFELNGDKVSARTFVEIAPAVRRIMAKHGMKGSAESAVAAYMCPRIPDPGRYCTGPTVPVAHVRPHEAIEQSLTYIKRRVVAFDTIERRMQMCHTCPKHSRDWCPTCTGHVAQIIRQFGSRRAELPIDTASGVCQCAKAYEMAIASVEYGDDEKIWDGAPDTCWRHNDV